MQGLHSQIGEAAAGAGWFDGSDPMGQRERWVAEAKAQGHARRDVASTRLPCLKLYLPEIVKMAKLANQITITVNRLPSWHRGILRGKPRPAAVCDFLKRKWGLVMHSACHSREILSRLCKGQ